MGMVDSNLLERISKIMSYVRLSAGGKGGKRLKKKDKLSILGIQLETSALKPPPPPTFHASAKVCPRPPLFLAPCHFDMFFLISFMFLFFWGGGDGKRVLSSFLCYCSFFVCFFVCFIGRFVVVVTPVAGLIVCIAPPPPSPSLEHTT